MQPTPPDESRPTVAHAFRALVEHFEDLIAAGVRSPASLCMHREHIRSLSSHLDVRTPLADLDARVLESIARVEAQGRRIGRDGKRRRLSGGTLRKRMCTLRLALQLARRRGWIERVPEFPTVEHRYRPQRSHLRNWVEFERLCAALTLEQRDWVYLATFTAQHPRDVELMRAFDDAEPFADPPWMMIRNNKNGDRDGFKVAMPVPLAEVLRARIMRERLTAGALLVAPWHKDSRCTVLRSTSKRLGLDHITATSLRRTGASWAAHGLGSITRGLQEWLGHSNLEMLQRVYARALPPALADVAAALSAMQPRRPPLKSSPGVVPGEEKTPGAVQPAPGVGTKRRGAPTPPRLDEGISTTRRGVR